MKTKELLKIKKEADNGSASAQYKFARANYWGTGGFEALDGQVSQSSNFDRDIASKYYCQSAKQGYALAIKGLKRMAAEGDKLAIECQKEI